MQNYKEFDFVILIPVFHDDDKIGPLKKTNIDEGIIKFINWYDEYFNDKK